MLEPSLEVLELVSLCACLHASHACTLMNLGILGVQCLCFCHTLLEPLPGNVRCGHQSSSESRRHTWSSYLCQDEQVV